MINVNKAIASAFKTGKIAFGISEAIKSIKIGKAQLVIVASNTPPQIRSDLERYGKLSQIPVIIYKGSNTDLGMVCGRQFTVTTLTVKEPGDSDILKLAEETVIEETEES